MREMEEIGVDKSRLTVLQKNTDWRKQEKPHQITEGYVNCVSY